MKKDVSKIFIQPSRNSITDKIISNQLDFIKEHGITGKTSSANWSLIISQFKFGSNHIDHMEVLNCKDGTKIVVGSFYGNVKNDGMASVSSARPYKDLYSKACTSMFFRIKGRTKNKIFEVIL